MTIKEKDLKNVLAILFKVDIDEINDDSSMDNVEKWDSLSHLKLVLALEDEFKISFTEEECPDLTKIKIQGKLSTLGSVEVKKSRRIRTW